MFSFRFYDYEKQPLNTSQNILDAIDHSSIEASTAVGYGERSFSFNLLCTDYQARAYFRYFSTQVYLIEVLYDNEAVWVGVKDISSPQLDDYENGPIRCLFVGYYSDLDNNLIDKVWIDKFAVKGIFEDESRSQSEEQKKGGKELDGNKLKTRMLAKDETIAMGADYYYLRYKSSGGYPLQSYETTFQTRSGEGVRARFLNGGTQIGNYDLLFTGDQTELNTKTISTTTVSGSDTDTLDILIGTSATDTVILNYGSGTTQLPKDLLVNENAIVIPFHKDFVRLVSDVTVYMNVSSGTLTFRAAIYDDSNNKLGDFDNEVVVNTVTPLVQAVTFTKAGGLNIGQLTGANLLYYLVIRSSVAGGTLPSIGFLGVGSVSVPSGFIAGSYRRSAILGGAYPNFPLTFADSSTYNTDWIKADFSLINQDELELDQNDLVIFEDMTIKQKYHPLHTDYINPTYTVKGILQDIAREYLDNFAYDDALIADSINGGGSVEYSAIVGDGVLPVATVINRLLLLSSDKDFYYLVYAYDNNRVPRIKVIEREPVQLETNYYISTKDKNVKVSLNSTPQIRNYIYVTYLDTNGQKRIISPRTHPQLESVASQESGYGKRAFTFDAGANRTEAEALNIGLGILANFAFQRPSGTVRIRDTVRLVGSTTRRAVQFIKAGQTITINDYDTGNGVVSLRYLISGVNYTANGNEATLTFDEAELSENILKALSKPLNIID